MKFRRRLRAFRPVVLVVDDESAIAGTGGRNYTETAVAMTAYDAEEALKQP